MAKFHDMGILRQVFDKKESKREQTIHGDDEGSIVDVYNYCARFDAVPAMEMQTREENPGTGRRVPRVSKQLKTLECTMNFEKQGIKGTGRSHNARTAQIRAACSFKVEAERYQKTQGSESLFIKESMALTIETSEKFIEFYNIVRPALKFEFTLTEMPKLRNYNGSHLFQGQGVINGEAVGASVFGSSKEKTRKLAVLTSAVAIKNSEPSLFPRYLRALEQGNGQILRPIPPFDMRVDEDCFLVMRETLLAARGAGLPDQAPDIGAEEGENDVFQRPFRPPLPPNESESRSTVLKRNFDEFQKDLKLAQLREKRADLPMSQHRAQVLDLINNNMYSIIVGATGSGKTTQVPQILLENAITQDNGAACNVICTQPRRIAAMSVARRVAEEKAEPLQNSVGYHVRFDAKPPQNGGSIMYCTTGILLQQLQHIPDSVLDNVSHIVVDEVHERDMLSDFLFIILKKNLLRRKIEGKSTPHVVLMSATMDPELFASYFKNDVPGQGLVDCPSLTVPGRTFPVKEKYLEEILEEMKQSGQSMSNIYTDRTSKEYLEHEEGLTKDETSSASPAGNEDRSMIDWKRQRITSPDGQSAITDHRIDSLVPIGLIGSTIAHVARTTQEGAILVFLPGLEDITKIETDLLQGHDLFGIDFNDETRFRIIKLHSSLPDAQTNVFASAPEGCRKIILSTNIAETSVTIPDVQHVIDTGKLKEKQYDSIRRITMLLCTWMSKSNAKQRAGRAGRVQNGNYYGLYSKERYDSMQAIGLPELLRSDLQEICLDIKSQAFETPLREFLAESLQPPARAAVDASVRNLQALDALTYDEQITPLGRLLAQLPVHPSLGKMIVLGIIFRCFDPMLILGAAATERALFLSPPHSREEADKTKLSFVEGSGSDHIALLNAVKEMRKVREAQGEFGLKNFAHRNFLHYNAFRTICAVAGQIEEILVEAGLIPFTPARARVGLQLGEPSLNENSHKIPLIKALALSGTHPNLAVAYDGVFFRTPGEAKAIISTASTNSVPKHDTFRRTQDPRRAHGTMYFFNAMSKSKDGPQVMLRDTTEATPLMALLFGGKLHRNLERPNVIEVDDWLPFYVLSSDRRTPQTMVEFRKALERLLAVAFKELGHAAKQKNMSRRGTQRMEYFADEKVRRLFAGGLAEVLDRDVRGKESTRQRGWSRDFDTGGGRQKRHSIYEEDEKRNSPGTHAHGSVRSHGYPGTHALGNVRTHGYL